MMNIFFSPTFILVKKLHSALQEIFQCRQKLIHTHYTRSLNDDFEIKNELKKLHIEPFTYMPRHYKNTKKQIFSRKKLSIPTIKFCVLLPLIAKSAS